MEGPAPAARSFRQVQLGDDLVRLAERRQRPSEKKTAAGTVRDPVGPKRVDVRLLLSRLYSVRHQFGEGEVGQTSTGRSSLLTRRWREMDSNPRSPGRAKR
jgi:hypothetical protein